MATTGADLSLIFDRKIDKAYSDYYNSVKRNQLFKEALLSSIELKYKELDQQKEYDEIGSVIKTETVFTPTSNQLYLTTAGSPNISDYRHLLSVKCKYLSYLGLTASHVKNVSPVVVTINQQNNLRTGDLVNISSVVGTTNANGSFYIKKIGLQKIGLYSDKNLSVPIAGNADYVFGGIVSRVFYQYARPYMSDRKISVYGKPTVDSPKFEVVTGKLKLYPSDVNCDEITMDYITTAAVFIDVTDSTIDLELTYPYKFLTYVAETAARMFSTEVKDKEGFDFANFDVNTNN